MITVRYAADPLLGSVKLVPNAPSTGAPVIFLHGAGSDASYILDPYGRQNHLARAIVDSGHVGESRDNGGPASWGNQRDMNALDATYAALRPSGGKVVLAASSMGAAVALNWAARNPAKVACIVATIPVISLTDIHGGNRWGFAAQIASAHGGWSEASKGTLWNPATQATAGKYAGIPMMFTYGLADDLCLPGITEAFAEAAGSVTLAPRTTGHAEATYASVDHDQVVEFITEHAGA